MNFLNKTNRQTYLKSQRRHTLKNRGSTIYLFLDAILVVLLWHSATGHFHKRKKKRSFRNLKAVTSNKERKKYVEGST